MKRVGVILAFLFLVSFASASISVGNVSLKQNYFPYETISGTINLTILNEAINSSLTSSLGQSAKLIDVLNSTSYTCNPSDCLANYQASEGETSKVIQVNGEKIFGFKLNGGIIQSLNISFNISSDFGQENEIPLKINFFGIRNYNFTISSNNYSRYVSNGCFDSSDIQEMDIDSSYSYCEKVYIPATNSVLVGANVSGTDTKELTVNLYDSTLTLKKTCNFLPSTANSCIMNFSESLAQGNYYACIKSKNNENPNYTISYEISGTKCGWFISSSDLAALNSNSSKDFAIFAKVPKYAAAGNFKLSILDPNLVSDANQFIQAKYSANCANGCVLPITVSGVNQNLAISDVKIYYVVYSSGPVNDNNVYDVAAIPGKLSFSGVLNLARTGFNVTLSGNKTLTLKLNNQELFSKSIYVYSAPVIRDVYPVNPLAGVPVEFIADVSGNVSLYSWDFGDGKKETSTTNRITHAYSGLGSYTLILNVTGNNNYASSKSFAIVAGSPKEIINLTIENKRNSLNHTLTTIKTFPLWYRPVLENATQVNNYIYELNRLEAQKANAVTDSDFLNLTLKIQALDVPYSVYVSEVSTSALMTSLDDINPVVVNDYTVGTANNVSLTEYKNPILQWQKQNIDSSVVRQKVSFVKQNSQIVDIMVIYGLSISSNADEESYIVINKPKDDLYFNNEDASVKRQGQSTIITLGELADKNLEFYYFGNQNAGIFVSPKLTTLQIAADIEACNFNKICEKDLDENSDNCIADCKPWGKIIFYVFLVFVFGLILYTLLQMWYKARYETYLFRDRRHLFNLVMFITNARVRGMTDAQIRDELLKQKWTSEQITYAIKKSRGQRTGMYEIIPIEKLFAYSRKKKAIANMNNININKPPIQGITRW